MPSSQVFTPKSFKIPESVLVVIYTPALDVLLIERAAGSMLADSLRDWQLENIYEIYPRWRHRYAPGVVHNTEHLFGLQVPHGTPVRLSTPEHTDWQWLPYQPAAQACFSPSNAEACLLLPHFVKRAA